MRQLNLDSQKSSYLELVRLSCLLRVDKEVEGSFSGNERSRTSSNHDDEEEEEVEGVAGERRDDCYSAILPKNTKAWNYSWCWWHVGMPTLSVSRFLFDFRFLDV